MAHHVGIGEVHHDQVIARADHLDQFIGNLLRGHFWGQVIGRDLGAGGHEAILARFGRFLAAVQEKGDMGVFLGFRQAELAQAMACDPGAQRVDHLALGIGGGHVFVMPGAVVDHAKQRGPCGAVIVVELGE